VSEALPALLTSHPAMSRRSNTTGREMVPYGYVAVIFDLRGIGASYGQHHGDFNIDERFDLKAVIEWIAAQSWCTGYVGMLGNSYAGSIQHVAASAQPPHLASIHPSSAAFDTYKQFYPNGVSALPTIGPPPISLSGIPVDEDTPPDYPLLQAAIQSHYGSTGELNWRVPGMFRDAWSDDTQNRPLIDHSPQTYSKEIKASGVRMYQIAGWYDHHLDEQLVAFNAFGNKVIVGPWTHAMTDPILNVEKLRWLDYSLKGIKNGILDEPPIYYYTTNAPSGRQWRFGPEWPLPGQELKKYFLDSGPSGTVTSVNDGILRTKHPRDSYPKGYTAKDDYTVNYDISVFNGVYRRDRRNFAGDMTPSPDAKGLTYTTEPLGVDMEVTGNPIIRLWVNSTATDGHFLAYLEEVDSSGFSRYVTDGVIRASFRKISKGWDGQICRDMSRNPFWKPPRPNNDMDPAVLWSAVGIPYLRGFEEDYTLLTGKPTELVFDLFSTSYVFRKGNRIRVTITCGHKEFYQYPEGLKLDPPPVVSVYHDARYPSSITLPMTPPKPTVFEGTAKVKLPGVTYEGAAELYVWKTAIYINYDGKWLKWDTERSWEAGKTEHYMGRGDTGHISVFVTSNDRVHFDALATGNGIHFKGEVKN
jgi:putative CocE/NonD family hydrolase